MNEDFGQSSSNLLGRSQNGSKVELEGMKTVEQGKQGLGLGAWTAAIKEGKAQRSVFQRQSRKYLGQKKMTLNKGY